jgi:hypothetical protein
MKKQLKFRDKAHPSAQYKKWICRIYEFFNF